MQLATGGQAQFVTENIKILFKRRNRVLLGMNIVDAKAASHVDARRNDACGFEFVEQIVDVVAKRHVNL